MNRFETFSVTEFEEVCQYITVRRFRKRQFIVQEGDHQRFETFLLNGCTRTYRIDERGSIYILELSQENNWVSDPSYVYENQAATLNIDCLEDVEALQISKYGLKELYQRVPRFESYIRLQYKYRYQHSLEQMYLRLSKAKKALYMDFLERYPDLQLRVPSQQIAAFLGMTPQSLSRVRRQSMQKTRSIPSGTLVAI